MGNVHGPTSCQQFEQLDIQWIFVEPFPDLNAIPYGMVIVGGNNEIISELAGEVEVDNEHYKQEYEDYCIGKIRATIDM